MTFDAILAQVQALLQREQRLSYRALQRRFALEEADIEALKDELIYAKRLAVDEDDRVLVWVGDTGTAPASASEALQSAMAQAEHQTERPILPGLPAVVQSPPEAERRQLTVLFCDLVDSTRLARQLDPEDWRDVVQAYQQACAAVIQHFDGYIAQYLGDGLLVYFGYPQAHEDDAQRAGRASLGILEALGPLNARLEQDRGLRLAVRVGVHTGPVVVGAMGGGGRQEHLALGETPNIAARLQELAGPNTVVVSAATLGLLAGFFTCQTLGEHVLKGVDEPLRVYQLLAESGAQTRLDVVPPRGLTPLVGREQEVGLLLERWAESTEGHGQVVLLSGEAGIGKSRLVEVLRQRIGREQAMWLTFRCSPYHTNSALYPVITHLQRVLQLRPEEPPAARLDRLEHALRAVRLPLEETVPLVAALLSVPWTERYPPLDWSPQKHKQKTYEALVVWLMAEAEHQPVLVVWEDLHWADPSTLEWLGLVLDQTPAVPLCHLLTCRPEFPPPWAPRSYLTQLTLARLTPPQVADMVRRVTGGKSLPAEVVQQIVAKTDGVPLFVEELTKMVLESGLLQEREERYELTGPLPPLAIPATLHDSLMARLDRLATVKSLAQLGATLGREFSYDLLRAVAPWEESIVHQGLAQLLEAEFLYQRGVPPQATYVFKHALIQDTAYQSLLRSTRQQYHQRIAQVLEAQFPAVVETAPEVVAHHYTEAGCPTPAVTYWQIAGQRAAQRSAHQEAVGHLTTGVAVLQSLPDTPERTQQDLLFQVALGVSLMAVQGRAAPEVARVYTRARALCQQVGDTPQLFPVLRGLVLFYLNCGQRQTAQELAEQLLHQAERQPEVAPRMLGHYLLGQVLFIGGALREAGQHFAQAMAAYHLQEHRPLAHVYGIDLGVITRSLGALVLWLRGYPDRALAQSQEAVTLAQDVAHPLSQVLAQVWLARLHQFRQEAPGAHDWAAGSIALATQQGLAALYVAWGTMSQGWALTRQGQWAAGIAQLQEGSAAALATGSELWRPYFLALLAEATGAAGQPEDGLHLLAEAQEVMARTDERFYEAELARLAGVLQLAHAPAAMEDAEASMRHALAVARDQEAKALELRAALSLSRLWQQQGQRAAAYGLLAPIYGWFTEGFDTADLQDARALLEELAVEGPQQ